MSMYKVEEEEVDNLRFSQAEYSRQSRLGIRKPLEEQRSNVLSLTYGQGQKGTSILKDDNVINTKEPLQLRHRTSKKFIQKGKDQYLEDKECNKFSNLYKEA